MEIPWCVSLSRWEGRLLRCSLHFLCEDLCFSWSMVHNVALCYWNGAQHRSRKCIRSLQGSQGIGEEQPLCNNVTIFYCFQPGILNIRMIWHGKVKKHTSFFVGTSPEFEISLYTLCMLARTNSDCNLEINQSQVPIKTFDVHHVPGLQIGSAYPALWSSVSHSKHA